MALPRADTETAAANGALALIGEPAMADIAADTAPARNSRLHFGTERDALLREYHWNFATAWVMPGADVAAALGPLTKRYLLPADCLAVRSVDELEEDQWAVESAVATDGAGAAIETMVLVTSIDAPLCCYTRRVETVALWDPLFLKVFQARLAMPLGPVLGRDVASARAILAEEEPKLQRAKRADAREKARKTVNTDTSWLAARRGFLRR